MILGIYLAYGNDYLYSSLIVLAISLAFMIYNLVNLPFIDTYQNYRATLCHFTLMFIIFVANFYTVMKVNTPLEVKSRMFTVAKLEIILILICVFVSLGCLIYEIYLYIYNKCHKSESKIKPKESDNSRNQINITQEDIMATV